MSDFTNEIEVSGGTFSYITESSVVDFIESGDVGLIRIEGSAYGEGVYGEGPYGGSETITLSSGTTTWTNIDTP